MMSDLTEFLWTIAFLLGSWIAVVFLIERVW